MAIRDAFAVLELRAAGGENLEQLNSPTL